MKNKRKIIIVVLLLIALLLFFLLNKKAPDKSLPVFTLQGSTTIGAGDMVMKIWDNNTEDGDTVAVYFEGKMLLDSLPLLYVPAILQLGNLIPGEYLLGVVSINEGMVGPSTCTISLSNGTEEQEFVMDAWIDSAASWNIIIQ